MAEPPHLDLFREWLGITELGLSFLLDQQRNPRYWKQTGNRDWIFTNDPIADERESKHLADIGFQSHEQLKCEEDNHHYVVVGKGYP
jgi:hypothetical protein